MLFKYYAENVEKLLQHIAASVLLGSLFIVERKESARTAC